MVAEAIRPRSLPLDKLEKEVGLLRRALAEGGEIALRPEDGVGRGEVGPESKNAAEEPADGGPGNLAIFGVSGEPANDRVRGLALNLFQKLRQKPGFSDTGLSGNDDHPLFPPFDLAPK